MASEDILDAIDSVTLYNGLYPVVLGWLKLESDDYSIKCPDNYGLAPIRMENGIYTYAPSEWYMDKAQLQVLWMIAVVLFGDYGTSPRFGWILKENEEAFHKWILDITKTGREEEVDG